MHTMLSYYTAFYVPFASTSFLGYYPAEEVTPQYQEMPHLRCLQYFCYHIFLRLLSTSSPHSLLMCIL